MAYGELIPLYPTVYTDLIAPVIAEFVSSGWTQVGATGIYKSATPDANGLYAYVRIDDSGLKLRAEVGCRLNEAGDDFADSIIKMADFSTGAGYGWYVVIYPLWFMVYGAEHLTSKVRDAYLGGGLYRALPGSEWELSPYYIEGDEGVSLDEIGWDAQRTAIMYGMRVNNPLQAEYHIQRWHMLSYRAASATSPIILQGVFGNGAMILPVSILSDQKSSLIGHQYNSVNFIRGGVSVNNDVGMAGGQELEINGVAYRSHPRWSLFSLTSGGMVLFMSPAEFV